MKEEQNIIRMAYIKRLRRRKYADFIIDEKKGVYFESYINTNYICTKLYIGDHCITYYSKGEFQAWDQPIEWLCTNGYLERDDWI